MTLGKGDHLVIKREGKILTPDAHEAYHEFEVTDDNMEDRLVWPDGTPCPDDNKDPHWYDGKTLGVDYFQIYKVPVKVVK